jgi:hypothetical protein
MWIFADYSLNSPLYKHLLSATGWSLVQRSPTECDVSKKCDREASKNKEA